MVLTQKKINDAILKAECCLASKTIKYFNQLSYGKDDMNLFKCINVLDIAIETLCKFEIVGSTSECPCTIEGTFLIEGLNQLIQFNNDGTGYVNNQAFIWYIDNSVVHVIFPNQQCYQTSGDGIPELGTECASYTWDNLAIEIYIGNPGDPLSRTLIYDAGFDEIHNTEELIADFNQNNTVGAQIELNCTEECCYYFFTNLPTNLGNQIIFFYGFHTLGASPLESQDCGENYTFNYTCDENGNLILNNFNDFLTYIASLNITSPPFTDTNITLSILDNNDVLQDTVTVSSNDTPEEIVNQFNEDNTLNLVMQYNAPNNYQVYSPLFNGYAGYTFFTWNQVEAPFTALFNITSWGNTSQALEFTDSNNIVYTFSNPGGGDETTFMLLLEAWLETQPFEMTVVFNENVMTFSTNDPLFSGTQPSSVQLTLIEGIEETSYDSPFTTNVVYETTFESAETLNLINQEECTPETIEQTCLSNKQIGDIINYINKTCTDC
jgi:hypothetical protein